MTTEPEEKHITTKTPRESLATPATLPGAETSPSSKGAENSEGSQGETRESAARAERIERIGRGGFGEVWRVRYLGSDEVWKYVPLETAPEEHTLREAIHSRRIEHPNVVRVFDVFREGDSWILRMELIEGRDLFRIVREEGILDVEQVVRAALQVSDALQAAHERGIVHLDLKPHNLILREEDKRVMLTDFGISASIVRDFAVEEVGRGTPYFMAPEQIHGKSGIEPQADIWSFGVSLYFLLTGEYPFDFGGRDYRDAILESSPISLLEREPVLDPELWTFLRRCLEKDPARRYPSMRALADELRAWWESPDCPRAYREGQIRYAHSDFDVAATFFEKVQRGKGDEVSAYAARAEAAVAECHAANEALDQHLEEVRDQIRKERLLDAFRVARAIPPRYSHSPERKELLETILRESHQRLDNARQRVEGLLRSANFREAKSCLDEVYAFLSYRPLRITLLDEEEEEWEAGEGRSDGTLTQLYRTIEEREGLYHQHLQTFDEAVNSLNLESAKEELGTLYHWFRKREHLAKIRDLNRAGESLSALSGYSLERLEGLVEGRLEIPDDDRLDFAGAQRHCQDLVRTFPPERYPRMAEFEILSEALERTAEELRERGNRALEVARDAKEEGRLEDAFHHLQSHLAIIVRTDLFSPEVQDEARRILDEARHRTDKADERHAEALAALQENRFARALGALEDVKRLDPRRFPDLEEMLARARESSERSLTLADDLQPLYYAILTWSPQMEDVLSYLQRAEELCGLQDESSAAETRQRMGEVFARSLSFALERVQRSEDPEYFRAILRELEPLARDSMGQAYLAPLRGSKIVCLAFEELVEGVVKRIDAEIETPDRRLAAIEDLSEILASWRHLLAAMRLDGRDRHPLQQVSDWIALEARGLRGPRSERLHHLGQARRSLERVTQLGSPELSGRLRRLLKQVRRLEQRQLYGGRLLVGARALLWVLVPLGVAAGVVALTWRHVEIRTGEERLAGIEGFLRDHEIPVGSRGADFADPADREWGRVVTFLEGTWPQWVRAREGAPERPGLAWLASCVEVRADLEALVDTLERSGWTSSDVWASEWRQRIDAAVAEEVASLCASLQREPTAPIDLEGADPLEDLARLRGELSQLEGALASVLEGSPLATPAELDRLERDSREIHGRLAAHEARLWEIRRLLEDLGAPASVGADDTERLLRPRSEQTGDHQARVQRVDSIRGAIAGLLTELERPLGLPVSGRVRDDLQRALLWSLLRTLARHFERPPEETDALALEGVFHHIPEVVHELLAKSPRLREVAIATRWEDLREVVELVGLSAVAAR